MQECVIGAKRSVDRDFLRNAVRIWSLDDSALIQRLTKVKQPAAAQFARKLLTRDLPKRACVFGRSYLRSYTPVEQIFRGMSADDQKVLYREITGNSLERLLRSKSLRGTRQRDLEKSIELEAISLAALLKGKVSFLPNSERPSIVSVLPMPNTEANRADCIILENNRLNSTASSSISDEQMEAVDIVKSTGYVLTDSSWRYLVFLASRMVFNNLSLEESEASLRPYDGLEKTVKVKARLLLDQSEMIRKIQLDSSKLEIVNNTAAEMGYFDKAPRLAPLDIDMQLVAKVAGNLSDFNGQGGWRVSNETIRAFLSQFPPKLRKAALELLTKITVMGRTEVASQIRKALEKIGAIPGRGLIVGLSPDSGSGVRMLLEQEFRTALGSRYQFFKTVRDALQDAREEDSLILCDDNVTSGFQAWCQFYAWLGVPDNEWTDAQLRENGIERSALGDKDRETLLNVPLYLATAAGTDAANVFLREKLEARTRFSGRVLWPTTDRSRSHTRGPGAIS